MAQHSQEFTLANFGTPVVTVYLFHVSSLALSTERFATLEPKFEANRLALGGRAKAVREALLRLGMRRCSLRLVHYQAEPRPLRLDWYGLYWRWLRALHLAHPSGADFLFEDLRSRYSALRQGGELAAADWYEQVAECEREHSEAIRAAILDRDPRLIRKEIAEAISALRRQLALLDAREGAEGRSLVAVI